MTSGNRDGFGSVSWHSCWHDRSVSEPYEPDDDVVLDPSVLVGAWANASRVSRGRDEVTIDFVRHALGEERPIRVARVLVPPLAAAELRDQLDDAWRGYHHWQMPEDVDD